MIHAANISKRFNGFQLKDISFDLPSGYIMGLIGENGAGKTTLLNILCGLYSYDSGEIRIEGQDYRTAEAAIRQELGVVLHEELFEAGEFLLKNAARFGRFYENYDESILREYMNRFSLEDKKYKQLSKGEKLKFALAFALAHKPKILLLDEPSANFDTDFRKEFHQVLREFTSSGENSVILSTHITSDVEQYADYILFLKKGKQLLYGDIESIRGSYRMVSGEAYKIKLLKERVIHMETGDFTCKALVQHKKMPYDAMLKTWEPSVEELMYHMVKGGLLK